MNLKEGFQGLKSTEKYEYFDWYDYKKVEKLNEKRSMQWLKLYGKMMDARDKGDEKALEKAREAMRKHEAEDEICKRKADETGYYWC